jgi:hypothetical protein
MVETKIAFGAHERNHAPRHNIGKTGDTQKMKD